MSLIAPSCLTLSKENTCRQTSTVEAVLSTCCTACTTSQQDRTGCLPSKCHNISSLQFCPKTRIPKSHAFASFPGACACTARLSGFFGEVTSALDSLVHLVPGAAGGTCLPLCFQSLYAALTVAGPSMGTMSLLTNCNIARPLYCSEEEEKKKMKN